MMLLAVGANFRTAPIEVRERLAFDEAALPAALEEATARYGCEAVILSTCNRVEIYIGRVAPDTVAGSPGPRAVARSPDRATRADLVAEFLAESRRVRVDDLRPHLYEHRDAEAVRHLFRVVASLDSLIIGEGQIAGQVKRAYETAQQCASVGPLLHALFQHSRLVAGRVRHETGIAHGHVSVSSAAVDYVRQVFEHFGAKTVLVIGAGKMGELTLRHLRQLQPRAILVTNRSFEKAETVARECGGSALPWQQLDEALSRADIVLSTTGATEPIMTFERYEKIRERNPSRTVVILDIAVPRDFDPRIHDGDRTCVFNIDDLKRIREQTLHDRRKHLAAAEAIVVEEQKRFLAEWSRRRNGPIIARLTEDLEAKRMAIVEQLLARLNGRLTEADRKDIEGAFRLLQNKFLHGPISALTEAAHEGGGHHLLDALRKLFRLQD